MTPSKDLPVRSPGHDSPALQQLQRLYKDSEVEILILTGSAGTGKTTLVGQLVQALSSNKQRATLLASTGRAAKILSEKTGLPASTIHSAIYHFNSLQGLDDLRHKDQLSMDKAGQLYLRFDLKFNPFAQEERPDIFIVDEASMLTHETSNRDHTAMFGTGSLLDDFICYASKYKIMFVGDPCQLPPISHNPLSSALDAELLANRYGKNVGVIELSRIWRQSEGNEILDIATWYRDRILERRTYKGMRVPVPDGRNVHLTSGIPKMIERYLEVIGEDRDYNRATFIALSNKLVSQLNDQIRTRLGYQGPLQIGELLSVVQNSYTSSLMNGDLVVVEDIQPDITRAGLHFARVTVRVLHSGQLTSSLLLTDLLYNAEPGLQKEDAGKLLIDYIHRMWDRGIKPKTPAFTEGLRTDPYLNALRCKFGYALTAHKSQGGEWDEVFIAINKGIDYLQGEAAARWFYTAFTRARQHAWINDGVWMESAKPKVRIIKPKVN